MQFSITLAIVIITALISYRGFQNREVVDILKHSPFLEKKNGQWYRVITSGFVHADWIHLGVNMYVLYEFGTIVEKYFIVWFGQSGMFIYLAMYLLAIIAGSFPSLMRHTNNALSAAVGASGAVSAVVFIFIMIAPWSMLGIMFIIPMPAVLAGVAFLLYSSWADKRGSRGLSGRPIAHMAHFYGAVFGMLFVSMIRSEVMFEFFNQLAHPTFSF